MSKAKYGVQVPRSRGLDGPKILSTEFTAKVINPGISAVDEISTIRDLIIHAGIARAAYVDNHTEELVTNYDIDTDTVDLDIPANLLDDITKVNIGPSFEKYLSWLTNGVTNLRTETVQFTIGGGGSVISAGLKGVGTQLGYDAVIQKVSIFADTTGSIDIDIWKTPAITYPPTVANTIVAGNPASIVGAQFNDNVSLTGWTLDADCEDVLFYNVNSATSITLVTVVIHMLRSYLTA